jgi:hypothetical protein
MHASAPPQNSYNIELSSAPRSMHSTMAIQPLPSHYPSVNESLMGFGQAGASNQFGYMNNDMEDQLTSYTPINYYESPRQVDYIQSNESSYLSAQSTPRERMPV